MAEKISKIYEGYTSKQISFVQMIWKELKGDGLSREFLLRQLDIHDKEVIREWLNDHAD